MGRGRTRLDAELVARGLAPSRAQAREAIAAGLVRLNGEVCAKPAQSVAAQDELDYTPAHPWASRGGVKLAHALDVFSVDPAGLDCLDVGASTGGFTDVLLARGARSVTAVDVGTGQLIARLRRDPRVRSLEQRDARSLEAGDFSAPPQLITCDASFIGVAQVLGAALTLAPDGARLIALFKPQFEVGRDAIGRGGRVRDLSAVRAAQTRTSGQLAEAGWPVVQWTESPIRGGAGAQEHLLLAQRRRSQA